MNIGVDPQTLDPRKARDLTSVTLVHMFFEGLTRLSKTGELEMAIAERVDQSEDGLRISFHLRNTFWSNKEAVTSFDFARSWKAILDPGFPTDIAYQLYGIKNARMAKLGKVDLNQVGISTPDAQTLIVELEKPMPHFLQLVSMSAFFPTPRSSEGFVCNGPFKLKEWRHSDQISVVKNLNYWQSEEVKLSQIDLMMVGSDAELQMYEEGKLDWAGSPLSVIPSDAIRSLKEKRQLQVHPFSATYFFRVNTEDRIGEKKNPLSSAAFRKALALSLDRKSIAEHVLQGGQIPAKGLVPPEMGLSEDGYFQENVERARSLLKEALLELNSTDFMPIRISYSGGERNAVIAQAVQKQWEVNLGLEVELEAVEPKVYSQRVSHREFQLAAGSWTADFYDPINFLEVFKYKDGSTNNTGWESGKYIDLLDRSDLCKSTDERKGVLREAEQMLMEQMPIIPIFHFALNYLQREGLEEVGLSSLGKIDFRWAHF